MKVALFSSKSYDKDYFTRINSVYKYELTFYETSLKTDTVKLAAGFDAVCAFVNDRITRSTIIELNKYGVKIIALRCAGFNNVDLEAAYEYKIKVVRVPAYSPHAVAEHAVALILSLNRKIHKAYHRVRDNNFSLERLAGFDLYGKKMGIIGTGNIGLEFAKIMTGFGCKVQAYDVKVNPDVEVLGVNYMDLETLFKTSDIISLHCPLTPETNEIINKETLSMMKKGVMLINTSRGKLINTRDVIDSLKNRHLGYLGIDVYAEEEKLFFKDLSEKIIDDEEISRLLSFPNVLITAHQGFLTHEALDQIAKTTLQNIKDHFAGNSNDNEVSIKHIKS
jgi:D-lactate dehydrogenase